MALEMRTKNIISVISNENCNKSFPSVIANVYRDDGIYFMGNFRQNTENKKIYKIFIGNFVINLIRQDFSTEYLLVNLNELKLDSYPFPLSTSSFSL